MGREQLEDFLHIDFIRRTGKAAVAEDNAQRLAHGYFLHDLFADAWSETGYQIAVIVGVNDYAVHLLLCVRQRKGQPPVQQAAVEHIHVRAIILDIADHILQVALRVFSGGVVHILHVAVIQLQNTEADVGNGFRLTISFCLVCGFHFRLDFLPGAANALLANFADVFVSGPSGFAVRRANIW